jgi:hypothetical protein
MAFKEGLGSYSEIAAQYGVEKTKLFRVVNGTQKHDSKRGRPTAVPEHVEAEIVKMLLILIDNRCYLDVVMLPQLVKDWCAALDIASPRLKCGGNWLRAFFKRHPELSSRKAGKINRARSLFFNSLTHAEWYAAVKEFIGLYKSEEVFNTDDSG